MTIDELNNLNKNEIVIITNICDDLNTYHSYIIGDELEFLSIKPEYSYTSRAQDGNIYVFLMIRNDHKMLCEFGEDVCGYMEIKKVLVRNEKLNELGI
jgi:hypothetical protein